MLRTAAYKSLKFTRPHPYARTLHLRALAPVRPKSNNRLPSVLFVSITASAALVLAWHSTTNVVHNDAALASPLTTHQDVQVQSPNTHSTPIDRHGSLQTFVWGSNRSHVLNFGDALGMEVIVRPHHATWLQDTALRDLALHEGHAACVDARGDVYQWGDAFFASCSATAGGNPLKPTLQGKDIIKLQLTESRVYALSSRGKIYVLAANEAQQRRTSSRPRTTWWSWALSSLWGNEMQVDYVQLSPREELRWREHFTSIAVGRDHLLALTSAGRVFAHPVSKNANSHGQLGLYKINLPAPSNLQGGTSPARISAELIPKAVADPYAKTSSSIRPVVANDELDLVDDRHTGFSDSLFEIPTLRGVKVSQISAGSRSSYVNTDTGRILAWGSNEHGQLGLGSGITLDTILDPTEVALSRNTTKAKCLGISAGGDLACFIAERTGPDGPSYVDVLMCGNGQWGGIGNNLYTTAQANPTCAKNVSGLVEYDEKIQGLAPVVPHAISISPTGHVLLTLDTLSRAGSGTDGRDLVVWGRSQDFQLGMGKRGSVAIPTILEWPKGTRFLLEKRKAMVKDLAGKVWKRYVDVEQCAVAGYGSSVVYWKIRS